MNTISEEQVLHNELSFEINQELIHLMKRIIEIQKQNTELKEDKFKLQARSDRVINNWNKLKEYMTKEQARIVIENTNEDEFVYTDLLIKMQELEKGGMNDR